MDIVQLQNDVKFAENVKDYFKNQSLLVAKWDTNRELPDLNLISARNPLGSLGQATPSPAMCRKGVL